jgi:hypothetical protein
LRRVFVLYTVAGWKETVLATMSVTQWLEPFLVLRDSWKGRSGRLYGLIASMPDQVRREAGGSIPRVRAGSVVSCTVVT